MLAAKREDTGLLSRGVKSCYFRSCFINLQLIPRSQSPSPWLSSLLLAVHLKSWSAYCVYSPAQGRYLPYRPGQLRQNENKWALSCHIDTESLVGHTKQNNTNHLFLIPAFKENKKLILFPNVFCICFHECCKYMQL